MKAYRYTFITRTILYFLFSIGFITFIVLKGFFPSAHAQESMFENTSYPPPEYVNEGSQFMDNESYPPPYVQTSTATPTLAIPTDHIVIVSSNGRVEEINQDLPNNRSIINYGEDYKYVKPTMGKPLMDSIQENQIIDRIIGTDDRIMIADTTIFPWRAVVRIEGFVDEVTMFHCTGWMLGPSTVVTAGHCIYSKIQESWAFNVTISPGYNEEGQNPFPFGSCQPTVAKVLSPWFIDGDIGYDYGVYELACRVGEITGNFGFRVTGGSGVGLFEAVVGYPGDKGGETMWTGGGTITSSDHLSFYYDNDTMGGQSGGPVFVTIPECNPCVIAVHANEFDAPTMNQGARITEDAFYFFLAEQQIGANVIFFPIILKE